MPADRLARRYGYNQASDLLTRTADGFDLNELWAEYQNAANFQNQELQTLVSFVTFPVTNNIERVNQISGAEFEKASEYGEPRGIRPSVGTWKMGYTFDWWDLAARFTWKFLADAPRAQVDAINAMAIEADNRLIFREVFHTLFSNVNRLADIDGDLDVNVYALYNADGTVPPKYKTNVFDGTHNHFLTSGTVNVEPADIDDMVTHLAHHGYTKENGMRQVLLTNPREADVIRGFNRQAGAKFDFIPAQGSPTQLMPVDTMILGSQVPSSIGGISVAGSYGDVIVAYDEYIPVGYMALIATGGRDNLNNPVGFRQHSNPGLRGMRLVKGPVSDYPLIDSFYNRGFGTGIRHRGGSVVMQVTTAATYTAPTRELLLASD